MTDERSRVKQNNTIYKNRDITKVWTRN